MLSTQLLGGTSPALERTVHFVHGEASALDKRRPGGCMRYEVLYTTKTARTTLPTVTSELSCDHEHHVLVGLAGAEVQAVVLLHFGLCSGVPRNTR